MGVWDLVCTELGGGLGSIFMTILNRQHPKNGGMLGVFRGGPRNLGWGLGKGPSLDSERGRPQVWMRLLFLWSGLLAILSHRLRYGQGQRKGSKGF